MANTLTGLLAHSPTLLDGGLGTTLEDYIGLDISHSPLWSAQPIALASEAILKAHLLFLRAGARILSTSTYQCSLETFKEASYDSEQAKSLMLKSVLIAKKAKEAFEEESMEADHPHQQPVLIALSLGPFGATLKPTQEFRGYYPPPYGPRQYSDNHKNENAFQEDEQDQENIAIDALSHFHYDRLLVFASSVDTWSCIDCISFETVPLQREVMAIRRAIQRLQSWLVDHGREGEIKPWWISCVFPNGTSPGELRPGGPNAQIDHVLATTFSKVDTTCGLLPTPSGFGINCTKPEYMPALAGAAGNYFRLSQATTDAKPWLILYPNGDDVYNEETRSWMGKADGSHVKWAEEVSRVVAYIMGANLGGVIVGGCCKTGPDHISSLRSKLHL